MRRLSFIFPAILIFLFVMIFSSCDYGLYFFDATQKDADSRSSSISVLSGDQLPELDLSTTPVYSFVVIADVHIGTTLENNRDEDAFVKSFTNLLKSTNEGERPRFVVSAGDQLDSGKKSQADTYNELMARLTEAAKRELGVSRFYTYNILGNHDLYNGGWNVWKDEIYPYKSFYKISLGNFSYYFLDSANGTLGSSQLEAFESDAARDSNKKICFSHYPFYANGIWLFTIQDSKERARVLTTLVNDDFCFLGEGHKHQVIESKLGPVTEMVTGSLAFQRVYTLVTVNNNTKEISARSIYF